MSEEELELLEQHLKERSRNFIKSAYISLAVIVGVLIIGILFYFLGGRLVMNKSSHLNQEKLQLIHNLTDKQLKGVIGVVNEQELSKEGYYKILHKFRDDSVKMSHTLSEIERNQFLIIILAIGATIGLVFLQAFLIHTLEGIYNYNKRLGEYFENRADSVRLTGSTINHEEETLAKFLTPENMSIGTPLIKASPHAKNTAKEILRIGPSGES